MSKVVFVDLDGVIANSSVRFERAKKENGKYNWAIALDPELVVLDELIEGTPQAVLDLIDLGFEPIYLTGRPEKMRQATKVWLAIHDLPAGIIKMRKDGDYRKASIVKTEAVGWYLAEHTDVETVVIVDDETENATAIMDNTVLGAQESEIKVYLSSTLAGALGMLKESA